jgi:hypothetical protein
MRAALALLLLLAAAGPASAAVLALTEAQRREAVQAGERSVHSETFDAEWRVAGDPGESVSVLTPFHRLVIAARHAAFRNGQLKPAEAARLLQEQDKRLVFWVALRGPREDFARGYAPRLLVGDRDVKPTFVQNERTAARQEDGRFLARCVYAFPTRDVTATSRVALVVAGEDGRELRRFTIDLSTMR